LSVMTGLGWSLRLAWPYFAGLLCAFGLALYQYTLIRARDPQSCFRAFRDNNWVGGVVFAGIVLAYLLRASV
jgi:4-hydroxybenzoate polyprenyltransferase